MNKYKHNTVKQNWRTGEAEIAYLNIYNAVHTVSNIDKMKWHVMNFWERYLFNHSVPNSIELIYLVFLSLTVLVL